MRANFLKHNFIYFLLFTGRRKPFSLIFLYRAYYYFSIRSIAFFFGKLDYVLSIYVGGSLASGDFIPGLSDIDFAFILKDKNFSNNEQKLKRLYSFFSKVIPILELERHIIGIKAKDVTESFKIGIANLIVAYQLTEEKKYWNKIYGADLLKETGTIQLRFEPYAYLEKLNHIWRKFYMANNEARVYKRDHIFCNISRDLFRLCAKDSCDGIENTAYCLSNADKDVVNKLESIREDNFLRRLDGKDCKKLEQIFFKIGMYSANKYADRLKDKSEPLEGNNILRYRFTDLPIHALNAQNIKSLRDGLGKNFNITCLSSILYEIDAICVFIDAGIDDLPLLSDLIRKIRFSDNYMQRIWLYMAPSFSSFNAAVSLDIYTDKHSDKFFLTPFHDPFIFQAYSKENYIKHFDLTYLKLFLEYELLGFVDLLKGGNIYKLCDAYLYQSILKIYQFSLLSRLLHRNESIEMPITSKDIIDSAGIFFKEDKNFFNDSYFEYLKIFKGEKHDLGKYRKYALDFCFRISRELYGHNE